MLRGQLSSLVVLGLLLMGLLPTTISTTSWHTAAVVHAAGIRGKRSLLATLLVLTGGSKIFNIENDRSFDQILEDSKEKVVVVSLFDEISDRSQRLTGSVFEQLAGITHTSDVPTVLCKANLKSVPSLKSKFNSNLTPAFLFIKGNQVVSEVPKANVQQLKEAFKKHVSVSIEDVLK